MLARWLLSDILISDRKNVLIYGAGSSGRQLSEALSQSSEYKPVAFIDDQKDFIKQSVNGIRIYTESALPDLIKKYQIQEFY